MVQLVIGLLMAALYAWNVSDGPDLAHGNGLGLMTIKKTRFEGNAGQQLKTTGSLHLERYHNNLVNLRAFFLWVKALPLTTSRPSKKEPSVFRKPLLTGWKTPKVLGLIPHPF